MTSEQLTRLKRVKHFRRYLGLRELVSDVEALLADYEALLKQKG